MSTDAQCTANRANAQHSSGPTSAAGKAASSQNNLSHGFESTFQVLLNESQDEYQQLLTAFTAEWSPAGPTEIALVKALSESHWLAGRAMRMQMVAWDSGSRSTATSTAVAHLDRMSRYQSQFDRAFQRTLNTLMKFRASRQKEQIGFELAKQRAEAEAVRQHQRETQIGLALRREERAARAEQRTIAKSEGDAAVCAAKIATQDAKKAVLDGAAEIDALMNMPIPGVGRTELQKNAFAEVMKSTLKGAA